MATFGDVWRGAQIEHPDVPALLLRKWAQDAYADLCRRFPFSHLLRDLDLQIAASRSVAVTATFGSATVTSAGLFLAADETRQFRVGTVPVYTIADSVNINTITLDRPYAATGGAVTAEILDTYYTCPVDFARFVCIADLDRQRPVPFWVSAEELNRVDPARAVSDTPRVLVATGPVPAAVATLAGRTRFEWWPYGTVAKYYPALYAVKPAVLVDTDEFPGVLSAYSDTIEDFILARSARWPGTAQHPNAMFNLALARLLQDEYDTSARQTFLRDRDVYPQGYSTDKWHRLSAWALAYDTTQLRATDASAFDYMSGG